MTDTSPTDVPEGLTPNPDWKWAVPAHGAFDAEACGRILALGGEMRDGTIGSKAVSIASTSGASPRALSAFWWALCRSCSTGATKLAGSSV